MWQSGMPYQLFLFPKAMNDLYSVFDSDGEFLLIEAAEYLPAWVTPSNAENRVRT
jgi:hypothetical protein